MRTPLASITGAASALATGDGLDPLAPHPALEAEALVRTGWPSVFLRGQDVLDRIESLGSPGLKPKRRGSPMLGLLPVLCLALASCASIVSKSDWPVTISSNPPGANLSITDEDGRVVHTGVTPMTLTLSSTEGFFQKADYDIEATLPGYNPAHTRMSAGINPWYFGNIIFGGLIGILIVDPATGAMWKLRKNFTLNLTSVSS